MRSAKACLAMAAFAALLVMPSIASALQLTAPTGTAVAGGSTLEGTGTAHASTGVNALMTTPIGTLSCSTHRMTGKILVNGPTHVLGEITTANFSNAGGAACSSPVGNVTVTPNHTSNPVHNGHSSLPWCITAGKEDQVTVWGKAGGSCSSGQTLPLTFTLHTALAGTCSYQKATVTATYTTHPAAGVMTTSGQNFTKTTGGAFCPSEGTLDMACTILIISGSTIIHIYIDN